ncbi:hypothetical protein FACS18948_5090 [Clostridia bacterium]|nr:hypothetical protein FACS18948_5090 [Clostridia bacterium]
MTIQVKERSPAGAFFVMDFVKSSHISIDISYSVYYNQHYGYSIIVKNSLLSVYISKSTTGASAERNHYDDRSSKNADKNAG